MLTKSTFVGVVGVSDHATESQEDYAEFSVRIKLSDLTAVVYDPQSATSPACGDCRPTTREILDSYLASKAEEG